MTTDDQIPVLATPTETVEAPALPVEEPKADEPKAAAANAQPAPTQTQTQAPSAARPAPGDASGGGSPVAVGSLASKARQKVSPTYPMIARAGRVTGVVTVYLVVNEQGEVETVQRMEGPMQLQQAAAEAARRWRFNPTVIDGRPVRIAGYLSFNFAL
jgi:protein TonB